MACSVEILKAWRTALCFVLTFSVWTDLSASEAPVKPINQYVHNLWRTEEGLPQNSVQAILQTRDGYLWLGTEEGLVRFSGTQFTLFHKASTTAIKHNDVRALLEDRQGNLWIGTFGGGVVRYWAGQFQGFTEQRGLSNNFVNALLEDRKGNIWIGTNAGLNRYANGTFQEIRDRGLPGEAFNTLAEDANGDLWAGTNTGLIRISKTGPTGGQIKIFLPHNVIKTLYVDHSGVLWIGTDQAGLYAVRAGKFVHYGHRQRLPRAPVQAILEDDRGSLWVGTGAGGLCRLANMRESRFECYTSKDGLSGNSVMSLFEDREKSIWAGTETGGLNRFKNGPIITYGAASGFNGAVRSIYGAHDGTLWVALDTGLRHVINGRVIPYLTSKGPANNYAWAVTEDRQGNIWVGTNEGGLNIFTKTGGVKTYTTRDGLADNQVHAVFQDHHGNMWIGTERGGVSLFTNGKFRNYTTADGLANNRVWTIFEDHRQSLWFGTDGGLSRFDHGKFTTVNLNNDPSGGSGGVMYIYEDRDHVMWIGTYGSGLKRLANGDLTTYAARNGLFDESVWTVLEDDFGNLWMSSNLGIFRVKKSELTAFAEGKLSKINSISYGMSDGMLGAECNGGSQNAGWKTPDGTLMFACVRGIVAVTPGKLSSNPLAPPVVVEQALINGKDLLRGDKKTGVGRGELEFHFAGLSYVAPEKVRFKYRLEGFDKEWIYADSRRVAYYTNIPAGSYSFRVIACNNDGLWNESGAVFDFYLAPRFYQTATFYAAVVLVLVLAGAGIYRLRIRALRKREAELLVVVNERTRELQAEILEREKIEQVLHTAKETAEAATRTKSEFLANMSHEIRTPLNGVIGMLDLMRRTALNEEQTEFLGMAASSATALLTVINDILDFSKVEAGKLELDTTDFELVETVWQSARTVALRAHQKNLEVTVWVDPELPRFLVGDPDRLKQVLINFLSNAVKFTDKGEIGLRVEMVARRLAEVDVKFSVSDTGVGIPAEKQQIIFGAFSQLDSSTTRKYGGTGLGLAICSRIVSLMGGTIQVASNPGDGSVFSFTLLLPISQDGSREVPTNSAASLNGVSVLVVDDNQTNRSILQGMLASARMSVTVVESGDLAVRKMLEAAKTGRPFTLMLLDYRMPGMNGYEVVQQVRMYPQLASAILMMLTSDDYHGTAQRCREVGINSCLIKPIKQSDLLRSIRGLLAQETPSFNPVPRTDEQPQPLKPMRILLAEDNPVNQRLAVVLLEKLRHKVAVANTGPEALAMVENEPFDLVLMDVQMPGMDGLAATTAIREREQLSGIHLPIIAMTAHAMKGDRERCLDAGMDGYISKPIDMEELHNTILSVLRDVATRKPDVARILTADTAQRRD